MVNCPRERSWQLRAPPIGLLQSNLFLSAPDKNKLTQPAPPCQNHLSHVVAWPRDGQNLRHCLAMGQLSGQQIDRAGSKPGAKKRVCFGSLAERQTRAAIYKMTALSRLLAICVIVASNNNNNLNLCEESRFWLARVSFESDAGASKRAKCLDTISWRECEACQC